VSLPIGTCSVHTEAVRSARKAFAKLVVEGKSGDSVSVCCPCHDDASPSLSLRSKGDGRVTWKCFAGCSYDAVGEALADAIYDYRDERGELLYQVLRLPGKAFSQRRPSGDRWEWKLTGTRRVLFNLPELLASDPDKPVFVVEGEKDVIRLTSIGLVATCNSGGADNWRDEYRDSLRDRAVVILPDNDTAGREHAEKIARSVHGAVTSLRVVSLSGLTDKGDVSDWLDAGGDVEELLRIVESSPEWKPTATEPTTTSTAVDRRWGSFQDVTPKTPNWLWDGRFALGTIALIAGQPKANKSTLATEIASRVSTGEPWPDDPTGKRREPASTVLITGEESLEYQMAPRLRVAGADCSRVHWLEMDSLEADLKTLDSCLREIGDVKLVVIDPISSFLGKTDSHKDASVRGALKPLAKLAEEHDVCVVLICHLNKKTDQKSAMNRVMGSVGFTALSRSNWLVARDANSDDKSRRMLLPLPSNIGKGRPGLSFRVEDAGIYEAPKIVWEGTIDDVSADDVVSEDSRKPTSKVDRAEEIIELMLADGPRPAKEIEDAAFAEGISKTGLHTASKRLGIEKKPGGFGKPVVWRMPGCLVEFG